MKILMVCLGNICRSPLAHGILQDRIDRLNLPWIVDSAGTNGYHNGEQPDSRSVLEAKRNGIDITNQVSRKITKEDIKNFDLIFAMDSSNYNNILQMCDNEIEKEKVRMIMNFSHPNKNINVPDPYYHDGFDKVFNMLENAIDAFLDTQKQKVS